MSLSTAQVAARLGIDPKKLRRAVRRDGRWSSPYLFTDEDLPLIQAMFNLAVAVEPDDPTIPPDTEGVRVEDYLLLRHNPIWRRMVEDERRCRHERLKARLKAIDLWAKSSLQEEGNHEPC